MSLVPFGFDDPLLDRFRRGMDSFMGDSLAFPRLTPHHRMGALDVSENEREFLVALEMPGVAKEDIKMDIDEETGLLTISAERKKERDERGETVSG